MAPIATVDEYANNFNYGYLSQMGNSCEILFNNENFVGGGSCRLNNMSSSKRRCRPSLPSFVN